MAIKKSILQELLIGVFKTDRVTYHDKQVLIEGASLLKKCDFDKPKNYIFYRASLEELFRLTFLDPCTEFYIDTNGLGYNLDRPKKNQVRFSRKNAVVNAVEYLTKQGVDFNILTDKDAADVENIDEILYTILWMITAYIFSNFNVDPEKEERSLKSSIALYLCKKSFGVGETKHTTESNCIIEYSLTKKECNSYMCIRSEDVGIPRVYSFNSVSADLYIINRKESKNKPSPVSTEWLMSGLGVYDPQKDEVIEIHSFPKLMYSELEYEIIEGEKCFITDICPDANAVIDFKIYYLLNIDANKVKILYSGVSNPYELSKAIISKKMQDITARFRQVIAAYYEEVIRYVEDVLDRIMRINLKKFIEGDIDADITAAFNIDYDVAIDFYKEQDALDEKDTYLYLTIDRAIGSFINEIKYGFDLLPTQICDNVNPDRIDIHIKKLEEFTESDIIKSAVLLQQADQEKNPDNYMSASVSAFDEGNVEIYTKRVKDRFLSLKNTIEEYKYLLRKATIK